MTRSRSVLHAVAAICVAATASLSSPAAADIVTVTYRGTVAFGNEGVGFFGGISDLTGQKYTAVYVFDTTLGHDVVNTPTSNHALGGSFFNSTSPALSATMTINNVSFTFQPSFFGFIAASNDPPPFPSSVAQHDARAFQQINDVVVSASLQHLIVSRDQDLPASLSGPVSNYVVDPQDTISALFGAEVRNSRTGLFSIFIQNARLSPESLSVTTAVPEPSTWAMMLLGFAGLGCLAYRRSRRVPA